jgi:hypothetical protein
MKAEFEYYMRRFSRYYFRNDKDKFSFDSMEILDLKYKQKVLIELK